MDSLQATVPSSFRVHLTNVVGTGAVQLVQSLLPALERAPGLRLQEIHLPDRGELADYRRSTPGPEPRRRRRLLANAASRLLECLWPGSALDGEAPLLVLGDLPLRCAGPQAVFVQTSHLTQASRAVDRVSAFKYWIARRVFRLNRHRPHAFIVQTEAMRSALVHSYPDIRERVHVVLQPAPAWLLAAQLKRTGRRVQGDAPLSLFYPAAPYPHKNHRLLSQVEKVAGSWPVTQLILTIPPAANPNAKVPWIHCVGLLPPAAVVAAYSEADALLFLSIAESYGLPLVEAMWIGLPVVCPDLPYARALCGSEAIYFDPDDINSLHKALTELHERLGRGWWPDWTDHLTAIPPDWNAVAKVMLEILFRGSGDATLAREERAPA